MKIIATIKDSESTWKEIFSAGYGSDAWQYVSSIVEGFNEARLEYELPRQLVSIEIQRYNDLPDKELAEQFIIAKQKQMLFLSKITLDGIWGDRAKQAYAFLKRTKMLTPLYNIVEDKHIWKDDFIEIIDEMKKRGWKRLRYDRKDK